MTSYYKSLMIMFVKKSTDLLLPKVSLLFTENVNENKTSGITTHLFEFCQYTVLKIV